MLNNNNMTMTNILKEEKKMNSKIGRDEKKNTSKIPCKKRTYATLECALELSHFTTIYNHINDVTKSKLLSTLRLYVHIGICE